MVDDRQGHCPWASGLSLPCFVLELNALVVFLVGQCGHPFLFSQELMMTSLEKTWFLRLAYRMQSGGATDNDHLAEAEADLWHLCEELGASQRVQTAA